MKFEAPKADGTNSLRGQGPVPQWTDHPKSGREPRPIRKRAFWRALKSGILWAVIPFSHMKDGGSCLTIGNNRFAKIIASPYCPSNQAFIMWPCND